MLPTKLAVLMVDEHRPRLQQLADDLQLPLLESSNFTNSEEQAQFALTIENSILGIKDLHSKAGLVAVDFEAGGAAHRRNQGGGELIVKAIGGNKQQRPSVLDVTAGLGRDSFVLASWGYPVDMVERSPVVASLLADGLMRAQSSTDYEIAGIAGQMSLENMDSASYLSCLQGEGRPDVIYMDPMFPPSKKSALVKKDMQVFHTIVGKESDDGAELLALALANAIYRVVVKRPKKAQFLAGRKPSHSLEGKAVRFDVYTIKALPK